MSKVLRGLGKETEVPTTKTVFEVQVVDTGMGRVLLERDGRALAKAEPASYTSKLWMVEFISLEGRNDFHVVSEEHAVDALEDIGRFYLAVKAGDV